MSERLIQALVFLIIIGSLWYLIHAVVTQIKKENEER